MMGEKQEDKRCQDISMTVLGALKGVRASSMRLINHGTNDYARWLVWDEGTQQFVVYAAKRANQTGVEVYAGTSEEEAVRALLKGTATEMLRGWLSGPDE